MSPDTDDDSRTDYEPYELRFERGVVHVGSAVADLHSVIKDFYDEDGHAAEVVVRQEGADGDGVPLEVAVDGERYDVAALASLPPDEARAVADNLWAAAEVAWALRNGDGEPPAPLGPDGEGLLKALYRAGAHADALAYVRRAREAGGTPMLESWRGWHRGGDGDVGRIPEVGTRKERLLWEEGAATALEQVGNWDTTNRPILEAIADAGGGEADGAGGGAA